MPSQMPNHIGTVTVVDPLRSAYWNETILSYQHSTIFHSANWARSLVESYSYKPIYIILNENNSFRGCIPIMEVNSFLTGRRGVCLSFSDSCPALVENASAFEVLFDRVLKIGETNGWRYVEFRGEHFLGRETPARAYAYHEVLLDDESKMKSRLKESTARNIRKAVREGVRVTMCQSLQGVREFYRLHCLTRKRQGVPPQPRLFFDKIYEHLIEKKLGFTALAKHGGAIIAGIICLHFGRNAIYKYGASDLEFQYLRANNLVLWETMIRCAREGFHTFSLGRTDLDNEGLLAFKNGWGAEKRILNYYKYDFLHKKFVPDVDKNVDILKCICKRVPIHILKVMGRLAYRHLG